MWRGLLIYISFYAILSLIYRMALSEYPTIKLNFERICVYCNNSATFIPLSFILVFYVSQVVQRYWQQYNCLPWPDALALNLAVYLPGDGKAKRIRRLVIRLANLSSIMSLRRMSPGIMRRFPTYDSLVDSGLMSTQEQKQLEEMHEITENMMQITWLPIQWAQAALVRAKEENLIKSDFYYTVLQKNLNDLYYNKISGLFSFAWINIPLVYTQLIAIAVYLYLFVELFGMQYLNPTMYLIKNGDYVEVPIGTPEAFNLAGYNTNIHDYYIPFFCIIQFIFFYGWLKVAESLINPFGEDDNDFDLNYLIDRNHQVSYLMVGFEADEYELEEDTFEGKIPPLRIPLQNAIAQHVQSLMG